MTGRPARPRTHAFGFAFTATLALTLALALALPAASAAQAGARARTTDAAAPWLAGGTLTFAIDWSGSARWERGGESRDRAEDAVGRHARVTLRLAARTSAENPLAGSVGATPPALGGDTLARLRRYVAAKEFQFDKAMALCGASQTCNRELGRLVDERMRRDMGSLAAPKPVASAGARFVILEPAGGASSACDSVRITLGDNASETRERADRRHDGPGPSWSRSWHGAWDLPDAPGLAVLCSATMVLDLQEGVYHLALPHGDRVTVPAKVLERQLSAAPDRDYVKDETEPVTIGGQAGPGLVFSNNTLPQLSDEIARRMARGREVTGSGSVARAFTVRLPGHWWPGREVPVEARVWWRYQARQ